MLNGFRNKLIKGAKHKARDVTGNMPYSPRTAWLGDNKIYYWVWTVDPETSRHVLWGPFDTEREAEEKAYSRYDQYEVRGLKTRDEATASRLMRAEMLADVEKFGDKDDIYRNLKHKI